jgi:hypothetical protein
MLFEKAAAHSARRATVSIRVAQCSVCTMKSRGCGVQLSTAILAATATVGHGFTSYRTVNRRLQADKVLTFKDDTRCVGIGCAQALADGADVFSDSDIWEARPAAKTSYSHGGSWLHDYKDIRESGPPTLIPRSVRRAVRDHRDPVPEGSVSICDSPDSPIRNACGLHMIERMGDYANAMDCSRAIVAPPGESLTLTFGLFDLEFGDRLDVIDGCTAEDEVIIRAATGGVRPTEVSSSQECLFLRFRSDASFTRSGFNATVTCNPPLRQTAKVCNNFLGDGGRQQTACRQRTIAGVQCIPLRDIPLGTVMHGNDRWWPNYATYECAKGYHVHPVEHRQRSCMPNRIYNGSTPSCRGNVCQDSPVPQGGLVRYWPADRRYPATVSHFCQAGFMVDTSDGAKAVRQCSSDLHGARSQLCLIQMYYIMIVLCQ